MTHGGPSDYNEDAIRTRLMNLRNLEAMHAMEDEIQRLQLKLHEYETRERSQHTSDSHFTFILERNQELEKLVVNSFQEAESMRSEMDRLDGKLRFTIEKMTEWRERAQLTDEDMQSQTTAIKDTYVSMSECFHKLEADHSVATKSIAKLLERKLQLKETITSQKQEIKGLKVRVEETQTLNQQLTEELKGLKLKLSRYDDEKQQRTQALLTQLEKTLEVQQQQLLKVAETSPESMRTCPECGDSQSLKEKFKRQLDSIARQWDKLHRELAEEKEAGNYARDSVVAKSEEIITLRSQLSVASQQLEKMRRYMKEAETSTSFERFVNLKAENILLSQQLEQAKSPMKPTSTNNSIELQKKLKSKNIFRAMARQSKAKENFSSILPVIPRKPSQNDTADQTRKSELRRLNSFISDRWRSNMDVAGDSLDKKQQLEFIKHVLASDPTTRADTDILFIYFTLSISNSLHLVYNWMRENCKNTNIFGSSHEYIGREICRQMRLIKLPSYAMLIRQGDTGDRCYILIDGLVDVYAKEDSLLVGCDENSAESQYSVVKPTTDFGEYKTTLGAGTVVGDVVLLNPTERRNATVIVSNLTQECHLVYLGRVDYVRLMRTVSMETSHYVQAEVLDFMYLFQKWPTADKMKYVAQMRSIHFSANEYLYRAGSTAQMMFIIVSGEVMEKQNLNMIDTNRVPSNKHKADIKINVDLMLLGPGELANEYAFLRASGVGGFDIKAVSDVQALGMPRHLYENILSSDKDYMKDMHHRLTSLASDREDWRRERLEFGSQYPDAHVAMTWNLMRMGNLRCSRCGRRGHLGSDLARCHHPKKYEWAPLLQRIDKQLGQSNAVILKMQRTTSSIVSTDVFSHSKRRRSIAGDAQMLIDNDNYLVSAQEQLAECWRQRLLVFPRLTTKPKQTEITASTDKDDDDSIE